MILSDLKIKEYVESDDMISPFIPKIVRTRMNESGNGEVVKAVSYGLGSYGYDVRLSSSEFYIQKKRRRTGVHKPMEHAAVNVKNFDTEFHLEKASHKKDEYGTYFEIPSQCGALGVVIEKLTMPNNITGIGFSKSTYSRSGLLVNFPPIEAGWKGHLTLFMYNTNSKPLRVYTEEGIAQIVFFEGTECLTAYHEREGGAKYEDEGAKVLVSKV